MTEKKSLAEWKTWVDDIDADEIGLIAEQANSAGFVRELLAQGYDAPEVHEVLRLFAHRLRALGQQPPAGGYVDLGWLAASG